MDEHTDYLWLHQLGEDDQSKNFTTTLDLTALDGEYTEVYSAQNFKLSPICSTMVGLNKCIIYPKFQANPYIKNLYPQFITFPKAMRRLSHDGG